LVHALPSTTSAEACASLFGGFIGSTARSDSSRAYASGLWLFTFPDRSPPAGDAPEVSRFSCILFRGVPGVLDYAGSGVGSRLTPPADVAFPQSGPGRHPSLSFVGSRTGALLRRFSLAVSPRFLWECLTSQTVSGFPAPATSNVACGFPALRSPVGFRSRFIRHGELEQLSRMPAGSACSRCTVRACGNSTPYSTVSSPGLCVIWTASDVAGSSFLPSLGSSKNTDSNVRSDNSSPNPGG
jgi:hypothetical protein